MNKTAATSNPQKRMGWRGLGATMSIQRQAEKSAQELNGLATSLAATVQQYQL